MTPHSGSDVSLIEMLDLEGFTLTHETLGIMVNQYLKISKNMKIKRSKSQISKKPLQPPPPHIIQVCANYYATPQMLHQYGFSPTYLSL